MGDIKRGNHIELRYRDEKIKIALHYILGKISGEGSYGKVKEGIDSKLKTRVAIKILSRKHLRRATGGEASVEREISILKSLDHKNIIKLFSCFSDEDKQRIYIVLEYANGGNLANFLEKVPDKRLGLFQARKFFSDLIAGLQYLKREKILHRDIKPENLLLTTDGDLKITDFGIAEQLEPKNDGTIFTGEPAGIGSPAFQAPELLSSTNFNKPKTNNDIVYRTDVWSAGIVLYIMLVGSYPFPSQDNLMQLFDDISEGRYTIPDWLEPNAKDLISKMLNINPEERIDIMDISRHPFMTMDIEKSNYIPILPLTTMFGNDKNSISLIIKKSKRLLEREKSRREKECEEEDDEDEETEECPKPRSRCTIS